MYISPFRVGRLIAFPRASVRPSVCLSVCLSVRSSHCRSLTWKPLNKLYSRNFKQISISIKRCAECKSHISCVHTFWVISLGTLSVSIMFAIQFYKIITCILASIVNFIQISTVIRQHADDKNHNTSFNTFWVISHGTLASLQLNRVRSITLERFKRRSSSYSRRAYLLFEEFPLELWPSLNGVQWCPLYSLKPLQAILMNLHININQRSATYRLQEP